MNNYAYALMAPVGFLAIGGLTGPRDILLMAFCYLAAVGVFSALDDLAEWRSQKPKN